MSHRSASSAATLAAASALALALAAHARGEGVIGAISREVRDVFERSRGAIVKIEGIDRLSRLSGTGFFIDDAGTLYTSYSVGGESRELRASFGGRSFPARRIVASARAGIALLKVEAQTPALPLAATGRVDVATPVIAIGYSLDLDVAPSFGLVAGQDMRYLDRFFSTTHLRANVPVQRGQGGAPLLDMAGRVIGIIVSSMEDGAGCFALPIDAAERVRAEYVATGEVRPAWVGVEVDSSHPADRCVPARIRHLPPGGPGATAGLQVGDVILQVGAVEIRRPIDVLDASFFLRVGQPAPIRVLRDGSEISFEVAPVARPDPARPGIDHPIPGPVAEGPRPATPPEEAPPTP